MGADTAQRYILGVFNPAVTSSNLSIPKPFVNEILELCFERDLLLRIALEHKKICARSVNYLCDCFRPDFEYFGQFGGYYKSIWVKN